MLKANNALLQRIAKAVKATCSGNDHALALNAITKRHSKDVVTPPVLAANAADFPETEHKHSKAYTLAINGTRESCKISRICVGTIIILN